MPDNPSQNRSAIGVWILILAVALMRTGPVLAVPPAESVLARNALPSHALMRLGSLDFRTGNPISSLVYTPDGKMVIAASHQECWIWETESGKPVHCLSVAPDSVSGVALAPGNDHILTWGVKSQVESELRLWELKTGKCVQRFSPNKGWSSQVQYSSDGKFFVSRGPHDVMIWETGQTKPLHKITPEDRRTFEAVAISPDSRTIATSRYQGPIQLWELATGKAILSWRGGGVRQVLAWSPDGKSLFAGDEKGGIRSWTAAGEGSLEWEAHQGGISGLSLSKDGSILATVGDDGCLKTWESQSGKLRHTFGQTTGPLRAVAFSPDQKTLATGGYEGLVRFWDVGTGKELRPPEGHAGGASAVALSVDGKYAASGGTDGSVCLWNLQTGKPRRLSEHVGEVWSVAFSPDSGLLASGGDDGKVCLWEVPSGKARACLKGHPGFVRGLTFSPDSKLLASGCGLWPPGEHAKQDIRIWDVASGKELHCWAAALGAYSLAFSPDGKRLAAAGIRQHLVVRDVATGRQLHSTTKPEEPLREFQFQFFYPGTMTFLPDGDTIAVGWPDDTLRWTDSHTGVFRKAPGWSFKSDQGCPWAFRYAWSSGLLLLFMPSADTVMLMDAFTHQPMFNLENDRSGFYGVDFSADGRVLATSGRDGSILLWDLTGRVKDGKFQLLATDRKQIERHWADLTSNHACKGQEAIWSLVAASDASVTYLQRLIEDIQKDSERVETALKELDASEFKAREAASRELETHGLLVERRLRQMLADKPSAEVRSRVERLLEKCSEAVPQGEHLRRLRTLVILQQIGVARALEILKELARDPNGLYRTEAVEALKRLK